MHRVKPGFGALLSACCLLCAVTNLSAANKKVVVLGIDGMDPKLLQTYVWQAYDIAPRFPALLKFLDFWRRELDGPLHSVTVAHARLIRPADLTALRQKLH